MAVWVNHEKTQVWASLIIKNNPSICTASPGAGSAEKHGKKKWKQKKCSSYEEGEKSLSLQSPCFSLPTFCWLLAVRKWERARFSPPENNTNPSKLKSNTQSTSQETILKRKTSQWELQLNAAGMRCLAPPLSLLPLSLLLSQGFNHNLTRTTPPLRRQDSLSPTSGLYSFLSFLDRQTDRHIDRYQCLIHLTSILTDNCHVIMWPVTLTSSSASATTSHPPSCRPLFSSLCPSAHFPPSCLAIETQRSGGHMGSNHGSLFWLPLTPTPSPWL